jgi:hypothetical protein
LLAENKGLNSNASSLSVFLAARLLGYLLFAAVAWELGALVSMPPAPRVILMGAVNISLALVLLWYAYSAKPVCGATCAAPKLVKIGAMKKSRVFRPAALGLLTGLSLCPPFVAAGLRAIQLGSVTLALLFFFSFFIGTSLWFLPFISMGCIARNEAVMTVTRMAMVLIALYYLSVGVIMMIGMNTHGH